MGEPSEGSRGRCVPDVPFRLEEELIWNELEFTGPKGSLDGLLFKMCPLESDGDQITNRYTDPYSLKCDLTVRMTSSHFKGWDMLQTADPS